MVGPLRGLERPTMTPTQHGTPGDAEGTTTIGLVTTDGVVLASDTRATMGNLIASKTVRKIFELDENMGLAVAGSVGDAQTLVRFLRSQVRTERVSTGRGMTVRAAATLLSNVMNRRKFTPYHVRLLLAGVDRRGGHVLSIDAAGGVGGQEERYQTAGSGSPFVFGVLEDRFDEDMDLEEGVGLAVDALAAAIGRDAASGNGLRVATITEDEGWEEVPPEDVQGLLEERGHLELTS